MSDSEYSVDLDRSEGRAIRLLQLYFYIEEHPGIKAQQLADIFKISMATLFRDVQTLKRIGIPIDLESNRGGYRIEKGSLQFLRVKGEDIRPLLIAKDVLQKLTVPQNGIFDRLLGKMLNTVREKEIERIESQLNNVIYFKLPIHQHGQIHSTELMHILSPLLEACINQWQVEFLYESSSGDTDLRTVNPYGLWLSNHYWYLAAWSIRERCLLKFSLDRIQEVIVHSDRPFEKPSDFALPELLEHSEWLPCSYADWSTCTIILELDHATGLKFSKQILHHSQHIEIPEDTTQPVIATFCLSRSMLRREFMPWLMSLGPTAKVIEPEWLKDEVIQHLKQWQALYNTE